MIDTFKGAFEHSSQLLGFVIGGILPWLLAVLPFIILLIYIDSKTRSKN